MEQNNNEIDLTELSVRLYHFFLRRYKLLGVFIAIGIIYGVYNYLINRDLFVNRTVAASYFIPASIIVDLINSLDEINSNNKDLICKSLNINMNEANNLIGIKADTIETINSNTPEKITTIEINITGTKSLNIESISKGIVNYVDSNAYINKEIGLERKKSEETILTCEQQIISLDSLQNNILKSSLATTNSNTVNSIKLNDKAYNFFHFDIIKLEQTKFDEQKNLDRMKGLYIIDQKNEIKTPSVSLVTNLLSKIIIFSIFGFVVCFILEFIRLAQLAEMKEKKSI
jgi:hypothetical protein